MRERFQEIATTPSVLAARTEYNGVAPLGRAAAADGGLGPAERDFIAASDGFYLATVSESGWPYVQYRGGPAGFLRVLDDRQLGYADLRGNRQYLTLGNARHDDRVALFLMDYARQRRLKLFGHLRMIDARQDPDLAQSLAVPGYPGKVERAALITVEGFDWNCPQHITPRFTQAELQPLLDELARLRAENAALRGN